LIIAAHGKSGLIGRHRLIEELPYFLRADEEWSQRELLAPLTANDAQSLALWRAIAHRTQFTKVLKVIGHYFADRATDRRLGRETRSSLLSSLVLESLHAFREKGIQWLRMRKYSKRCGPWTTKYGLMPRKRYSAS
jgi:hypothetical protein